MLLAHIQQFVDVVCWSVGTGLQ